MIMNRVADVFFIIGILLILYYFKTTEFVVIFNLMEFLIEEQHCLYFFIYKTFNYIELVSFFLFIGAIGKSAQLIFHT